MHRKVAAIEVPRPRWRVSGSYSRALSLPRTGLCVCLLPLVPAERGQDRRLVARPDAAAAIEQEEAGEDRRVARGLRRLEESKVGPSETRYEVSFLLSSTVVQPLEHV